MYLYTCWFLPSSSSHRKTSFVAKLTNEEKLFDNCAGHQLPEKGCPVKQKDLQQGILTAEILYFKKINST